VRALPNKKNPRLQSQRTDRGSLNKDRPSPQQAGFEDHRSPAVSQSHLQSKIDRSPRVAKQRKTIARVAAPSEPGFEGLAREAVQRQASPASVLQRDPTDQGLVDFIKVRADLAAEGYDLLCDQVEASKMQIDLLAFYAAPIQNAANLEIMKAKTRIAETAALVREKAALFPEEASEARAQAVALGSAATLKTPHALLAQWMTEAIQALGVVAITQAKAAGVLVNIRNEAVKMAKIALNAHEPHMMRGLLKVADTSAAAAADGDRAVNALNARDKVSSSGKEKLGFVTTVSDSLNNATTGVAFGAVGALDAGGVFSLSTATASALGVVGGVLGIFFGAIGTFLGVKNALQGARKKKALKKAKSNLSNASLEEIADYAIDQKGTKVVRNSAAAVGGLLAIGAGVLGLIALSVASFGIAAIVAGIVAGLVGLGFVGYKIIHSWRKRKSERNAFADELIDQITTHGEEEAQARQIVSDVGLDPNQAGEKKFRSKLSGKVGAYVKSKRILMAEGLIQKLIAGKPSEVFDSELILGALGVDPEWVRRQIEADKVNKAVGKVARKLSSW